MAKLVTRRGLLTGLGANSSALLLAGCDPLGSSPKFEEMVLSSGNWLAYRVHRLIGSDALAPEFSASEMSPVFRTNGNTMPDSADYQRMAAEQFSTWQLQVDGLVTAPTSYSLAELRAMPARSQITRHDCVEGWSAIGKWTGVPLALILNEVGLKPEARYLVFHCADTFGLGTKYYESIDLVDGYHPQTIIAYGMNDEILSVGHGAPIRLRVERQLGYKHAKYIMRIEAVASLAEVGMGKGGFWEDSSGYDWYAGI